jgi:hypothetical protein
MRVYWDQVLVGTIAPAAALAPVTLDPQGATLGERGFSAEVRPDGRHPTVYDYHRASAVSPWKGFAGWFTRTGDVQTLLTSADDRFVIAKAGDEIALAFDATALRSLPAGWTRTYLLRGDGFSKEMDINSASPDTVEPLPFHGMGRYPYGLPERYPETPEHIMYREHVNTRRVVKALPLLQETK